MTSAPSQITKADSHGWSLWERLAQKGPQFGHPETFNSCIAQSYWASFTVTLKNPAFFEEMFQFSGNQPGTGGLVTFKDSNWLMSIVLAYAPTSETTRRPTGLLGIRAFSGQDRQFRSEADGRLQWRRDPPGTLWPPPIRYGHGRSCQLHPLHNALYHQHVHAPETWRFDRCQCLWDRRIEMDLEMKGKALAVCAPPRETESSVRGVLDKNKDVITWLDSL